MQRHELMDAVGAAWNQLSKKRGYEVQHDAPVCIHVCKTIEESSPSLKLIKILIPEADDFQALLIGTIDGEPHLIDPVYMVWKKLPLETEPSLEDATLILPIRRGLDLKEHIPNFEDLEPGYTNALTQLIDQSAENGLFEYAQSTSF